MVEEIIERLFDIRYENKDRPEFNMGIDQAITVILRVVEEHRDDGK